MLFDELKRRLFFRWRKVERAANLVVRAAREDDAESIARLRKLADKERKNRNPPLDPYGGDYPTFQQQTEAIRDFSRNGVFLVAEIEHEIVGIVFAFEMNKGRGDYRLKVVVSRNWRNKGIGAALVSQVLEWAKGNQGVNLIVCAFHKSHRDAKHLLSKLGFTVHKQGWAWYMQGAMYNEVEMIYSCVRS